MGMMLDALLGKEKAGRAGFDGTPVALFALSPSPFPDLFTGVYLGLNFR